MRPTLMHANHGGGGGRIELHIVKGRPKISPVKSTKLCLEFFAKISNWNLCCWEFKHNDVTVAPQDFWTHCSFAGILNSIKPLETKVAFGILSIPNSLAFLDAHMERRIQEFHIWDSL